ncbi:hypothetical protein MKQ68_11190 [Chitinophaga horti]|uniref:Uncharacterized protein n=1 Tax=Chitinophaga horti TaxID=2920382 RepID=A0ABY6J7U1_9BACT|nr:hypothetical protein [Chitinophaga horti]UYQ95667.1 hypothetical protein MKQ68_11190 [Chitinophaga horti]
MPNLINIYVPVETFLRDIHPLIQNSGMRLYMETLQQETWNIVEIKNHDALENEINEHYYALYFSSEPFVKKQHGSFFDETFCIHAIELRGGRSDAAAIENLSLRIISKTPDKGVKSFMNKLSKHLKDNQAYGMGVEPATSTYHSKVFYHKQAIKGKTLWVDFKRKVVPTTVI